MKWFIFIILGLIFLSSPFLKGLYYNSSFYGITIIMAILYFLLVIRLILGKKEDGILFLYPIFLLPFWLFITRFTAENPKGSMETLIQWGAYSAFFVLLVWSTRQKTIHHFLPVIFQLTGVWLALIPFGMYYDFFYYRSSIVADRFAGVFQYPNTFGMIMAVFALFSMVMLTKKSLSWPMAILYSAPLTLFIVGMIQSYSRAMFILFPIIWFIGLVLLKRMQQIQFILFTVISVSLALIVYKYMETQSFTFALIVIFFFTAIVIIGKRISNRLSPKTAAFIPKNRFTIPATVFAIVIAGTLDLGYQGLLYKQLPETLQDRISSVSLSAATAEERMIFYQDALTISKESPFIGHGGESWVALNKKYQSLPYISNKIHNGYLEWLLDSGVIGLALFLLVLAYFGFFILNQYRRATENTLQVAVLLGLISIFSHSFLDFNFSYSTVWLTAFWLFAMGLSESNPDKKVHFKMKWLQNKYMKFVPLAATVFLALYSMIISFRFLQAEAHYKTYKESRSFHIKETVLERAIQLDPYNNNYLLKLSGLYALKLKKNSDPVLEEKFTGAVENYIALEPNNSYVYEKAGDLYINIRKQEEALYYYQLGLETDHYNKSLYEKVIKTNITTAQHLIEKGHHDQAALFLESAEKTYSKYIYWYEYFIQTAPKERERFNSREFTVTPVSHYFAALGYILQKDYDQAIYAAEQIKKGEPMKQRADALLVISYEKTGNPSGAEAIINKYNSSKEQFKSILEEARNKYKK